MFFTTVQLYYKLWLLKNARGLPPYKTPHSVETQYFVDSF